MDAKRPGEGVGSMRTSADKGGQKLAKSCGRILCMTPNNVRHQKNSSLQLRAVSMVNMSPTISFKLQIDQFGQESAKRSLGPKHKFGACIKNNRKCII